MEFNRVIVAVEGGAPTGGAERIAFDTVKVLSDRGISTVILSSAAEVSSEFANLPNVKVVCLNLELQFERFFRGGKAHMIRNLLQDHAVAEQLRNALMPYDGHSTVLHIHGYHNFFTQAIFQVTRPMKMRTVVTCHDFGLVCPNAMLFDYPTHTLCQIKPLSLACLKSPCMGPEAMRLKQLRYFRAKSLQLTSSKYRFIKKILAVSEHQRQIMAKSIPGHIDVLNNPVTPASTQKLNPELADHYLWIGRMTHEKDPLTPARTCQQIGAKISFIGNGPLEAETRQLCPDAEYLGWLTPNQVQIHQTSARALILSSQCYETASLVVLECLAAGIPCIVPDYSAATSWVQDGHNGLYFKAGDTASLATAIKRLNDDQEVRRMSHNAFEQYWKNPFTMERYAEELLKIYDDAVYNPFFDVGK